MAKSKGSSQSSKATTYSGEEGIAPYFRPILKANTKLLKDRSNKPLLEQWLKDHPSYSEVPPNVKSGLANLKSNMRKGLRKRRTKSSEAAAPATPGSAPTPVKLLSTNLADSNLEQLELLIDESMTIAKTLDREGLNEVIHLLRRARNGVVWKLGGGDE